LQQHLHKFLVLYRRLCIPHVGSFVVEEETARLDAENGLLFAPKPVIRFHEDNQPPSDIIFFNFLAEEMVVDEMTAIQEFHDFCFTARHTLQEHHMVAFAGIGRLSRREDESLLFTPETNLLDLLPPVPWEGTIATKSKKGKKKADTAPDDELITEETEEEVTAGRDRWWIYAVVLLAAGVLALLFYYQ
jgi:hypothetical protein